jgi:glycosyltransferase involved in cell wall biosynthesis
MKPKIAIIHYSAPPLIGGVESIIEAHSQLFADNDYPVKVIAGQGEIFDTQVELKIIPEMSSLSGWKRGKWKESLEQIIFKKLAREIRDRDFIIIHNCLTMPFNMALTTALRKLIEKACLPSGTERRKKFISWCHDSVFLDPSYKKFLAGVEENIFPYLLLKTALKKVHYVAISRSRAQGLTKLFNISLRKIRVIPDGIDLGKFLNLTPQVISLFKKFNLFQSDLIFLIPARVTRRKNIELALKITKEVNQRGLKAKTIITGPPDPHKKGGTSYLKFLKRLSKDLGIEDRIVFLSQIKVDFDLLRDLYKLSDILLLPSYQEGFGLPLLEAGLSRLPVFCSSIGPLKEVGGKEVYYFSLKENPKKIAQEILKFYKENKSLKMFKKVLRNYTWESIFKKKIEPYLHKL